MKTKRKLKNSRDYLDLKTSCDEVTDEKLFNFITKIEHQITKSFDYDLSDVQRIMVRVMNPDVKKPHLNSHVFLHNEKNVNFTIRHLQNDDLELSHVGITSLHSDYEADYGLKLVVNEVLE